MAEPDELNLDEELLDNPQGEEAISRQSRGNKKEPVGKKKKRRGSGFFLLLVMLMGLGVGLQASGAVDFRPWLYPMIPKVPVLGEKLVDILEVPAVYTLTVEERRKLELEETARLLSERLASIDQKEEQVNLTSRDLGALASALTQREALLAEQLKALSEDEQAGGMGRAPGSSTNIEQLMRTYEEMSPRNAAAILEKSNQALAVEILSRLPEDRTAQILARMDAGVAAGLTEQLASLKKNKN